MAYIPPLNGGRINASLIGTNVSGVSSLLSTGTMYLAGGNNITLSQNGASISIIGANGGGGDSLTMYGLGNNTYTSTGTFDVRSVSISANGAISAGFTNGALQLSSPVVSSVSATGILSISANGSTVTMGVPAYSAGISAGVGNTSGTTGFATNQLVLAGGNNITLSQSTGAGGNTLSVFGPTFSNSNGIGFGTNGSVITASHNGITSQSNPGASAGGNSFSFQTLGFGDANGVTFGTSAGSIVSASVNTSYAASNHSHGNPTLSLSNLSGATASASNGLTLSLSAAAQSNQAIAMTGTGNTTMSSAGTFDARSMVVRGGGIVSVGISSNTIHISATGGGGGGGSISAGGTNYTNGVSFVPSGALSFSTAAGSTLTMAVPAVSQLTYTGAVSMSSNGSTVSIGAPIMSLGMTSATAGGVTGGASGIVSNGLVLAAGSNISLTQSTNTNGATVTIYGASGGGGGGGGTLSMYAPGNTIPSQNTSASINAANVSLNGLGAMSVGYSGGSVQLSAPATSSIVAMSPLTISTNGNTISFSAPAASSMIGVNGITLSSSGNTISVSGPGAGGTISNWEPYPVQNVNLTQSVLGFKSVYFYKLQVPTNVSATQLMQLVSITQNTSSNSSVAATLTIAAGIYGASGSSLSLLTSGSNTIRWSNTSNNSLSLITGLRGMTLPMTVNMTPGNYWIGFWSNGTVNAAAMSYTASNVVVSNQSALSYLGFVGQASNQTQGIQEGVGMLGNSATSSTLPSLVAFSSISSQSRFNIAQMPYINFKNVTW